MADIRRAEIYESEALTEIAVRSEAYWGYDPDFMEHFRSVYGVTEEFIAGNPTYVIIEDNRIIGFYALMVGEKENSLEYLFIEPQYIGKGFGKRLWEHMIGKCEELGVKEFEIVTSPQAKEFYIKLGAVLVGEVESLVRRGRQVPRLIYKVEG